MKTRHSRTSADMITPSQGAPFAYAVLRLTGLRLSERQVAGDNHVDYGYDEQNAPPARETPGLRDGHPEDYGDHDIHDGNEKEDNPPNRFISDLAHEQNVQDRYPGIPAVFGAGLVGDGHQRKGEVYVDGEPEDEHRTAAYRKTCVHNDSFAC